MEGLGVKRGGVKALVLGTHAVMLSQCSQRTLQNGSARPALHFGLMPGPARKSRPSPTHKARFHA